MNMRVMNIELIRLRNLVPDLNWQAEIKVMRFMDKAILDMGVVDGDQVDQVVRMVGEKYRSAVNRFAMICNQMSDEMNAKRLQRVIGKVIGKNLIVRPPGESGEDWLTRCRSCGIEVQITGDMLRTGKNDGACAC